MGAQIKEPGCEQTADHQDQGTGDSRRDHPHPEHNDERDHADKNGHQAGIAERPEPGPQFLERIRAGDLGPRELGKLADHDVDRRAEQEAGDHGPGEELRDPAHLGAASRRNKTPEARVIAATRRHVLAPVIPATATALAATAASPELGPVEISRLVPKIA